LDRTEDVKTKSVALAVLFALWATTAVSHAANDAQQKIQRVVDANIRPAMAEYSIPGMAVGITIAGKAVLRNNVSIL
jgi:CubicO group peptidase (beta-lactamase class C family)